MRRALAAVAAAAAVLAGCGGSAGDLMSIAVSGVGPAHTVVITGDGRGSCDRGPDKILQSDDVLTARGVARRLKKLAAGADTFPARGRSFVASTKDGTVRWSETYRPLPAPLPEAELLALKLISQLCG